MLKINKCWGPFHSIQLYILSFSNLQIIRELLSFKNVLNMFCTHIKKINLLNYLKRKENPLIFAAAQGEMAEWSNAAVLKTVEGHTSGGSNPSSSAVYSLK